MNVFRCVIGVGLQSFEYTYRGWLLVSVLFMNLRIIIQSFTTFFFFQLLCNLCWLYVISCLFWLSMLATLYAGLYSLKNINLGWL